MMSEKFNHRAFVDAEGIQSNKLLLVLRIILHLRDSPLTKLMMLTVTSFHSFSHSAVYYV